MILKIAENGDDMPEMKGYPTDLRRFIVVWGVNVLWWGLAQSMQALNLTRKIPNLDGEIESTLQDMFVVFFAENTVSETASLAEVSSL